MRATGAADDIIRRRWEARCGDAHKVRLMGGVAARRRAAPVSRAASATARATTSTTRRLNRLGMS